MPNLLVEGVYCCHVGSVAGWRAVEADGRSKGWMMRKAFVGRYATGCSTQIARVGGEALKWTH